jgi:hypothetical protein
MRRASPLAILRLVKSSISRILSRSEGLAAICASKTSWEAQVLLGICWAEASTVSGVVAFFWQEIKSRKHRAETVSFLMCNDLVLKNAVTERWFASEGVIGFLIYHFRVKDAVLLRKIIK